MVLLTSYEDFKSEWIESLAFNAETTPTEKGHRFSHKLFSQWIDLDMDDNNIFICDGPQDGGIDIAMFQKGDDISNDTESVTGDRWYIVQSKFGTSYQGKNTLIEESIKLFDTLDKDVSNSRLNSESKRIVEKIQLFLSKISENDRFIYVIATVDPIPDNERALIDNDLKKFGKSKFGAGFEIEYINLQLIYQKALDDNKTLFANPIPLVAHMNEASTGLLVGYIKLVDLYSFLKNYKQIVGDLDQLYEKNVRKFLGSRGKVNKAIQMTLKDKPEKFGHLNNGITIVVDSYTPKNDNTIELIEPYVVNGCQTTRSIWEVLSVKLESGGTGEESPEFKRWYTRLSQGVITAKIITVGFDGNGLSQDVTISSNSQNAIKEKDFLALRDDFNTWKDEMRERYDIFLEIQRGSWDAQRAYQKQHPNSKQFILYANAFELIKVYGAAFLNYAGLAFGKNNPFLPNGRVFNEIVKNELSPFTSRSLYCCFLIQRKSEEIGFGRGSKRPTRGQSKFIFQMCLVRLFKKLVNEHFSTKSDKDIIGLLINLTKKSELWEDFCEGALMIVDEYFSPNEAESVYNEIEYKTSGDLNAFLKSEKLGKDEALTPRLMDAITVQYKAMKKGGESSSINRIVSYLKDLC